MRTLLDRLYGASLGLAAAFVVGVFLLMIGEAVVRKMGGYITGVIGVLIFPWKLIADPQGYIFKWLIAYSSLLGPVGGNRFKRSAIPPPQPDYRSTTRCD